MPPTESKRQNRGAPYSSAHAEVLLVDDDETWTRTQRRIIERYRPALAIRTAHSVRDARSHLESTLPDCVVCDYQLGDGTGLDLLSDVRNDHPDVPFVLVTGQGDETVASEAIGERVTDYVRKADLADQPGSLATRVGTIVDTSRAERALERERQSKAVLLDLVTASTTRRELGSGVCRYLVDEHDHECAWIGVLDRDRSLVALSAAGSTAYLEAALELGRKPATGTEPAVDALGQNGVTVIDRIAPAGDSANSDGHHGTEPNDRDGKRWRHAATEYGFRSAMAVPISHDGVRFGVLAVYDAIAGRFDQRTVDLLAECADTVGYGFKAAERRRLLLSSAVTSLEITLSTESSPLSVLAENLPQGATIEVQNVIPRTDDEVLYLASVTGASERETVDAHVAVPSIRALEVHEAGPPIRFGLIVEPPVPETVLAEAGGRFHRTVVDDGRVSVSGAVRTEESVRVVVDTLEETFTDASVTTVRSDHETTNWRGEGIERLTDRQRQVLELAVDAGYFERPRRHNTGELAEMLDITRATFTQHLRAAQSKVFDGVLSERRSPRGWE